MQILKTLYSDGIIYTACDITAPRDNSDSELVTDPVLEAQIDERHANMGLEVFVIEWTKEHPHSSIKDFEIKL